jgi:hypothetical protein
MSAAAAVAFLRQPDINLHSTFGQRTINELLLMYKNKQVNLEPGFQRKSVWGWSDRRRLIESVVSNYPLPSIFLFKRAVNGRLVYDVIDGKQRLETILMFTQDRHFRETFDVSLDLGEGEQWYDWRDICKRFSNVRAAFNAYSIQTVEVTGDLATIIDLFVRINSTGKRLSGGEARHARFYTSPFLKEAERLGTRYERYFTSEKIISRGQLDRMKGTELISELLMSIHKGGVINKKLALDRAISNEDINAHTLHKLSRIFVSSLNNLRRIFPDLRKTRFHQIADFYSLLMLVWEMRDSKYVLTNRKRNRIAARLLQEFSTGVDTLREQLKMVQPAKASQQLYADYLLTVQAGTDSAQNRQRRADILRGVLSSLFVRKDEKRLFSSEQRRILWHSEEKPRCRRCRRLLSWDNFTVDHVLAHRKGGKTSLRNAQILCKSCNSRKGGR